MKIVILEIVIIWFLAYLILECWYNNYLRKENKKLRGNLFSLKLQAALKDFHSNKKKSVKTFRYKNYQVKK